MGRVTAYKVAFLLVAPAAAEVCSSGFDSLWQNLAAGERAFLVDEAYAPLPDWDMRIMCHAKGSDGKVKDPFMDTKLRGTGSTSAMLTE